MLTQKQLQAAITGAVTNAVYDILGQIGVTPLPDTDYQPPAPGTLVPLPTASAPAPAPAAIPTMDKVPYQLLNGFRVDDKVPPGYPGTVTLPRTGHVLSVPRPGIGEMFVGYCQRVAFQASLDMADAELNENAVGSLFTGDSIGALFKRVGATFNTAGDFWPEAADAFFNIEAYMSQAEKDAETAAAQRWAEANSRLQQAQSEVQAATNGQAQVRAGRGLWRGRVKGSDTPVAG